jgi:predicted HNH restriction endonuclease
VHHINDVKLEKCITPRTSVKRQVTKNCVYCNKEFVGFYNIQKRKRFCSLKCSTAHKSEQAWLPKREAIERGETKLSENIESNNTYFKRYLIEKYGAKCMRCGWSVTNTFTKRIPIEIEHKDGDCTNNDLLNLELLCPNCHALTATYKGANKPMGGSKRYQMWKTYFK